MTENRISKFYARTLFILVGALILLVGLVLLTGCSSTDDTTDKQTVATSEADAVAPITQSAIVAASRNGEVLLVDELTETPFFPTNPATSVFDIDGNAIALADLQPGNVVAITGNGIMFESYPGQYPGIESIQIVSVGTPEDVEQYQVLVDEVLPEQGSTVPSGYVQYSDNLGIISVALNPYAYSWNYTNTNSTEEVEGSFYDSEGVIDPSVGDCIISEQTDVTIGFDINPNTLEITRTPLTQSSDSYAIDPDANFEAVDVELNNDGTATLTIEPNYAYAVKTIFDQGTINCAFVSAQA